VGYKFTFEESCCACMKGTNYACDECGRPFCSHGACLFETGKQLTFPANPDDEYPHEWSRAEEVCSSCYGKAVGHPPFALWADTNIHSTLAFRLLQKGTIAPAGDTHSWYAPPTAGKMLRLKWGEKTIEYDTFNTLQLLEFLKAHEQAIREQAKKTSDVLIPESHKQKEAAMRADAGCIDYSQYE